MAKFKKEESKPTAPAGFTVIARKSAAGEYMLRKGREYEIPTEIPADIAEQYMKAGLVEKVTKKSNTFSRSAAEREIR